MPAADSGEIDRLRGELLAARLTIQELQAANTELARRVEAERAAGRVFARQLKDLRRSRSWQLTAPLRIAMRRGRG